MRAMWQMWPAELSDATVEEIIRECERYPVHDATIGYEGAKANSEYRTSDLRWVNKTNPNSAWIAELIMEYATKANRNAFGFDIDYVSDIQYTTYRSENSGRYDWHHDTFWCSPLAYDRKVSVVMQLTAGSDYTGGEFEFDPQYPAPDAEKMRQRGTVFVFPSFISHRVTPVTAGIRKSLVSWVEGPSFR